MLEISTIAVAGRALADLADEHRGLGHVGQDEVEQEHVGRAGRELRERLGAAARRRDDLDVAVLLEHVTQEELHCPRVIAHRYPNRVGHSAAG